MKISKKSVEIRLKLLELLVGSGASHVGSCLSVVDILNAIYGIVDVEKIRSGDDSRDRIILSKGHAGAALYSTLWRYGLLGEEVLETFYKESSPMGGHVSHLIPYCEHSTGALGHGLSVAVGMLLAARARGLRNKAYVVVGDGELNEGTNWEAAQIAGSLGLENLYCIVDNNSLTQMSLKTKPCRLSDYEAAFRSFGFYAMTLRNGNDPDSIMGCLNKVDSVQPKAIICNTTKGFGVDFMEDSVEWHYRPLSRDDYEAAVSKLL